MWDSIKNGENRHKNGSKFKIYKAVVVHKHK